MFDIYIIFTMVVFIFILLPICYYCINYEADIEIPDVKWPFINIKDENDKNINMLCIRGPFHSDNNEKENIKLFKKYIKQGIKFIGCSSYLSYPRLCNNKNGYCHNTNNKLDGKNIEEYVLGWCHCFRDPDNYIKNNIPKILISESDFNSDRLIPDLNKEIIYDFVTFQPSDENCDYGWNSHNKNWNLAEYCIRIMCDKYNLKGVIIGRGDCPINIKNKKNIISTPFIKYDDAINYIQSSKFMLVANGEDASPRTITEALALDKPIIVNNDILGGWKYVVPETGLFFNKNNFEDKLKIFIYNIDKKKYKPRKHYIENYTIENSGKQLRDFLKSINPNLSDCKYAKFPIS